MTACQRVLEALQERDCKPRKSGAGWAARCPAHEDHNPSLSMSNGDGKVLIKCHHGCAVEDVLSSLGLTSGDLFDQPLEQVDKPQIVTTYPYVDEAGKLLYQVLRYEPKAFKQRKPDGAGGWSWRLGDVRRVPYQLPAVLAAVKAGTPVHVCEGEKDAHAVEAAGGVATCNAGGAGKWRPEYGDHLRGAHVVVVADRDAPGRAHARAVYDDLAGRAANVTVVEPAVGKDAYDHLAGGYRLEELVPVDLGDVVGDGDHPEGDAGDPPSRRLLLTPASAIKLRRVRWAWHERMAQGSLALLAGREGVGKSTFAYWLAARVTRGQLPGEHHGTPRAVLVAATEDSWSHTVVAKLIAHGADLDRVFRVEVMSADDIHVGLSLPRDVHRVEQAAQDTGAALLLLDPLMSRVDAKIDTHRDSEVRQALEPLAALADRTGLLVLGLIHLNKTGATDVLDRVMASKAFVAVARSVSVVLRDPDDEEGRRRIFGTPKNNLGRDDLPSLAFTVESYAVDTDDGPSSVGRIILGDETGTSVQEAMDRAREDPDERTATGDAADWLRGHLTEQGGEADSADVKAAAHKAGHAERTLQKARKRLHVVSSSVPGAMPRRTLWTLPAPSRALSPWGACMTDTTGINAGQSVMAPETTARLVVPVAPVLQYPREDGTTGDVPLPLMPPGDDEAEDPDSTGELGDLFADIDAPSQVNAGVDDQPEDHPADVDLFGQPSSTPQPAPPAGPRAGAGREHHQGADDDTCGTCGYRRDQLHHRYRCPAGPAGIAS